MLGTPLDYLSASETNHAIHRVDPPIQIGSVACDAGSWWVPSVGNHALPKHGRASDARKSRSRQQKPAEPTLPVLRFGGVFFEPSAKLANAFVRRLDVSVNRLLQNEPEVLEPVACLSWLQLNVANLVQELDHDDSIPASALQPKILRRFCQCLFQLAPGNRIHPCRSARTRFVDHTVEPLPVGFANPVHNRLTTDAEQTADSRRFPAGQKQHQPGDSNSVPGTRNRFGFAQQGLPRKGRMRQFEWFHAYSLIHHQLRCQVI